MITTTFKFHSPSTKKRFSIVFKQKEISSRKPLDVGRASKLLENMLTIQDPKQDWESIVRVCPCKKVVK